MFKPGDKVRFTKSMIYEFNYAGWNIKDRTYTIRKIFLSSSVNDIYATYNLIEIGGSFAERCFEQPNSNRSKFELLSWMKGE